MWQPKYRSYLKAATNGGQWPQARKAKLPNWQHGSLCEVCMAETGTADHRHCCPITRPADGWPKPGPAVKTFIHQLSPARKTLLANRAVLAVDVPTPAPQREDQAWQWGLLPDDLQDSTLRWYIDGSRKFPRHYDLATTGLWVSWCRSGRYISRLCSRNATKVVRLIGRCRNLGVVSHPQGSGQRPSNLHRLPRIANPGSNSAENGKRSHLDAY